MLNKLKSPKTKSTRKRVGRGIGSGKGGHTTGRGQKGQKSRSGYSKPRPGFEGGVMPLSRRIPKLKGSRRGSVKRSGINIALTLNQLEKIENGTKVDKKFLQDNGIIRNKSKRLIIKIIARGKFTKKLEITGLKLSAKAKKQIEKNGGKVLI